MTLAPHRGRSASRRRDRAARRAAPVADPDLPARRADQVVASPDRTAHPYYRTGRSEDRARRRVRDLAGRDQLTALLTILAAFWLFIGAWAIGYAETESGGDAYLNESVVGVLLLFLALSRYLRPLRQLFASVGTVLLGAWLIVSPFLLGYGERPYAAAGAPQLEWATGAVVLLLGVIGLLWARSARRSGFRPA